MLRLKDSHYFAKGYTRLCYIHPDDTGLCIKIPLEEKGDRKRRNKGILKAIKRENDYYKRLAKRNICWDHLSKYLGDIDTNLGRGSVYQLIRDKQGEIPKTLEYYLQSPEFIFKNEDSIINALKTLLDYMIENAISTTSLFPRNLVLDTTCTPLKLTIIDDIGNTEFIRFSELSNRLMKSKINRKWQKMHLFIQKNYNGLPQTFIDKLSKIITS